MEAILKQMEKTLLNLIQLDQTKTGIIMELILLLPKMGYLRMGTVKGIQLQIPKTIELKAKTQKTILHQEISTGKKVLL